MQYQDYIKMGFERTEMNCEAEYKQTGYRGFALEKKINDTMMVCVTSGDLDFPKLYIKKGDGETYHIIPIPTQAVIDLVKQYRVMELHFIELDSEFSEVVNSLFWDLI